jgi:hypothetical protein
VVYKWRLLSRPLTGVQRYAEEIVRALDGLLTEPGDGIRRFVHTRPATFRLEVRPMVALGARDKVTFGKQWTLPRYVFPGGLLSLKNTGPIAASKQSICIHDVKTRVVPQSYSKPFRIVYQSLLPTLGHRAAEIATVSG